MACSKRPEQHGVMACRKLQPAAALTTCASPQQHPQCAGLHSSPTHHVEAQDGGHLGGTLGGGGRVGVVARGLQGWQH